MRTLPEADPGCPDHRSPFRYLLWTARGERSAILGGASFATVWMAAQGAMPPVIGAAIDHGILARDGHALLIWAMVLLGLGIVEAVSGIMRHRFAVTCWLAGAYRTIQVVTRQATRLGDTLPRRLTTGEVVAVGTGDISRIGEAMDILCRGTSSVVAIIGVSVLLVWMQPLLGLLVVVGVPVIIAIAAPLLPPMHRRQHRARELTGELTTRASDIVAGLRVLRGIGGEQVFSDRYRAESQQVRAAGVAVARAESRLSGAEVLLPGLLIAAVTWLGARFAVDGRISVGQLVAFYGLAVYLIEPMRTIGEAADKITKAHVAAGRIVRILALEPEQPGDGSGVPVADGDLVDPTSGLVVRPGRLTAVVSADPAESRAVALRLGGYPDGQRPADWGRVPVPQVAGLRERVLVAVNEDRLFTGPLHEVIGGDAGVRAACAEDIVAAVGMDAYVTEDGREFSGGQQQRLRLARALAAGTDVLVLVEPTSAVDAHTEIAIAERLGPARRGATTVVCTTSPLLLDRADHVVYLERGQVAAEGAHRDLLAACPGYHLAVTREEAHSEV